MTIADTTKRFRSRPLRNQSDRANESEKHSNQQNQMKLNSPISKCKLFNGSQLTNSDNADSANADMMDPAGPVRFVATGSQLRIYKTDLVRSLQFADDIVDFQFHLDSYSLSVFTCSSIQLFDLYDFELIERFSVPQTEVGPVIGALWLNNENSEQKPSVIVFSAQGYRLFAGYRDRSVAGQMLWKPVPVDGDDKKSLLGKYAMLPKYHELGSSDISLIFWRDNRVLAVDLDLSTLAAAAVSKFSFKSLPGLAKDKFTCIDMCGAFVAIGTEVGKILVFDRGTLKCLQTVHWHHKGVTAVSVSDNLLLSGGRENAMLIYNIATQQKSVVPRLIESGLKHLKAVADSDYWICDIGKLDDYVSMAFSHKLIMIELSTCTKMGQDVNLIRFKPSNSFVTMPPGSSTKENMIISDGNALAFWSMHEGDNRLISQLQRTHTSFIRFDDGSLCLYADAERKLYFYDYDQNDGFSLNTALSVPANILKLVAVKDGSKSGADGFISTNSDATFSFYARIPAQRVVRDITQSDRQVETKSDFWKIILINKFRGQEIVDAAISEDILVLAHYNQITLWQLGTFEYLDTRNYPGQIKSICLNENYIAIQCVAKDVLIVENLVGTKFQIPFKSCTVEHVLPVTEHVRLALTKAGSRFSSLPLFMVMIAYPDKKKCNQLILITRDEIVHYKVIKELAIGASFSSVQYSSCGTGLIASSGSGHSLYQLSLLKRSGNDKQPKLHYEQTFVAAKEEPVVNVQSALFDTSDRITPPRKIEYTIDTTVHADLFDRMPCHLIDMDLVFSKIMNDKLHAIISTAQIMESAEDAMDVDSKPTEKVEKKDLPVTMKMSAKDLLQQIEGLNITVA